MPQQSGPPRFEIRRGPDGLRAILPTRKRWFGITLLSLWLIGWSVAEVMVIRSLLGHGGRQPTLIMLVWLGFWSLGGIWAAVFLLWQLLGTEVLTITSTTLSQRLEVLRFGYSRNYPLDGVTGLRVVYHDPNGYRRRRTFTPPLLGRGNGAIAFEYGKQAIYLGASLDETEAASVVAAFSRFLPGRL